VHQVNGSLAVDAGTSSITVEVSNVNGTDDGDLDNNTVAFDVTGYEFAEDRGVFIEEATGSWCPWCPRGAVYMDLLKECADQAFVGVAVHNQDPMMVN
jgi:thiol-disulfide isomerase/thioredoxin